MDSETGTSLPFCADYDKRGKAKCKRCKQEFEKGTLRIGKVTTNYFNNAGGDMKLWHHLDCIFESFLKARAATKRIDDAQDDIQGFDNLKDDDKETIKKKIIELQKNSPRKPVAKKATPAKPKQAAKFTTPKKDDSTGSTSNDKHSPTISTDPSGSFEESKVASAGKSDMFREFRRLCANIADESSYLAKTEIISRHFDTKKGNFDGDLGLWVRLLLPGVVKRVYNLQSKQIVKLFSQMFDVALDKMMLSLEGGDVAETVKISFEESKSDLKPLVKSVITLQVVDDYLNKLTQERSEEKQKHILTKIAKRCTANDLKMVIRLIKGDLRINSGAKHILEGIHPDAYESFQITRDLDNVLSMLSKGQNENVNMFAAKVMTPVLPMLAEACRSVDQAMKKCPNGMFAEIKYDGERVQMHKRGNEFKYYSRSLKPVMNHKVSHFETYIPSAFPHAKDIILDSEVLLIDNNTGLPLPFGSLGKHKKSEFEDANVCLFVFDCIHYNGKDLMKLSMRERRAILQKNIEEIKNRVVLSEMKEVHKAKQLNGMICSVLSQGLEGLVLKDVDGIYEPGKRHWLKVKKDYLHEGKMADSADLVVLGAWFGTGKRGGMMSVFLMGCHSNGKWHTVTKVHTGHDDARLEALQTELEMDKISQCVESKPYWLIANKSMIPDFVAKDPKKSPVWEVTGAEFTKNTTHTANGISIRFPRVTKERPDKTWKESTDLERLKELYEKSKEHTDIKGLKTDSEEEEDYTFMMKKVKDSKDFKENGKQSESNKENGKRVESNKESGKQTDLTKDIKTETKSEPNTPGKRKHEDDCQSTIKKIKSSNIDTEYKAPTKNPLPDYFRGVCINIPRSTEKFEELRRMVIACGGDVLDKGDLSKETHAISDDKIELSSSRPTESDLNALLQTAQLSKAWKTLCG